MMSAMCLKEKLGTEFNEDFFDLKDLIILLTSIELVSKKKKEFRCLEIKLRGLIFTCRILSARLQVTDEKYSLNLFDTEYGFDVNSPSISRVVSIFFLEFGFKTLSITFQISFESIASVVIFLCCTNGIN